MEFDTLILLLVGGYALLQWLIRGARKGKGGGAEEQQPDAAMKQAELEVRVRTRLERLQAKRQARITARAPDKTAARSPRDQATEQFRSAMEQLFGVRIEGQGGPLGRSRGVLLEPAEEIEDLEVLEAEPEVVSLETGGERLERVVVDHDDQAEALVQRRIAAGEARSGALTKADHTRFDQRIRTAPARPLPAQARFALPPEPAAPYTRSALRSAVIWAEILDPPVSRR
jgi:hypothetical protein